MPTVHVTIYALKRNSSALASIKKLKNFYKKNMYKSINSTDPNANEYHISFEVEEFKPYYVFAPICKMISEALTQKKKRFKEITASVVIPMGCYEIISIHCMDISREFVLAINESIDLRD